MANFGLFGLFGNYNRPGPGVSKDEPQKPPYIRYFQILGRKYGKLIQLNFLFLLPFVVAVFLMGVIFFMSPIHYQMLIPIGSNVLQLDVWTLYVTPIPLILLSPFVAGMTYVTRNFAREEHAFVLSDFKDAVKNNWKPFLLNGIFLYFAYLILSFSMIYYYNQSMMSSGFFIVPFSLCLLLSIVLFFCQYYIPIMIVTFDLSLRKIYRNALIFSVAGLWRNILLTAIFVGMLFLFYQALANVLGLTILLLFLVLFCFSFVSYTNSFIVYPLIEKLLIKPYYEQQNQAESAKTENTENAQYEEDLHKGEMDQEDAPEYVYINGRLMKRSDLNDEQLFEDKHY